jgi:hypothetical protein
MLKGLVVKSKDKKDKNHDKHGSSSDRHEKKKQKRSHHDHDSDSDEKHKKRRIRNEDENEQERERQIAKSKLGEQLRNLQAEEFKNQIILKTHANVHANVSDDDQNLEPTENSETGYALQREEWMTQAPQGGIFAGKLIGNDKEAPQQVEAPKPRELNPYYKDGGSGVPSEGSKTATTAVGDSGASWRARALARAKERAKEEGKSVDEVVKEHWNVSKDELEKTTGGGSFHNRDDSHRRRKKEYVMDLEKPKMKMPDQSHDLKWSKRREQSSDDDRSRRHSSESQREISFHRSRSPPQESKPVASVPSRIYAAASSAPARDDNEPVDPATQEKMNRIAAKALKAQLMNDMETYASLNAELESMKQSLGISQPRTQHRGHKETVALSDYDAYGKRIVKTDNEVANSSSDLRDLVMEAREGGIQNFDRQVAKSISKRSQYEEYIDEGHSMDVMGQDLLGGGRKKSAKRQQRSEDHRKQANRSAQIRDYKKQQSALEGCQFCFKGSAFKKHLVIALGEKTYLSIPPFGTLVPGHCLICTVEHQVTIHGTDEAEWNEIQRFKNCIRKMFLKQNKDIVFMETVTPYSLRKENHTFLECIPVPIEVGQEAPSYFKKALLESGSEWSDNPKLIDTTGKGIKRSVPSNFPYFYVEFALSGKGFAHIIENENKFSYQFGKEIVSGMLKLPGNSVKSLRSKGDEAERKQMLAFVDMFQPFDWTLELE